jgi:undecaprenyl-diphosphatase
MKRYADNVFGWIAAREASVLIALLLAAGAVWLFVEIADDVLAGDTRVTDEQLLLLSRTPGDTGDPLGPPWVEELARDVTALGSAAILALMTVAADLVAHGQVVYTSSFPSGHSLLSAVAFLTLGALLASGQTNVGLRSYLMGLAVFFTLIVGVSRVYLGVHWPSDVLAGWTAGAAWALLCWALARRLRARGTVE